MGFLTENSIEDNAFKRGVHETDTQYKNYILLLDQAIGAARTILQGYTSDPAAVAWVTQYQGVEQTPPPPPSPFQYD